MDPASTPAVRRAAVAESWGASFAGRRPIRRMASRDTRRRSYGSGSIFERAGVYYGKWRVAGRQVKRRLGPVRSPGATDGLTRTQAEKRLRDLMGETAAPPRDQRLTFEAAAMAYLTHLEEVMQRKQTTVQDYRIMLRRHLAPVFGRRPIDAVAPTDISDYITSKRRAGLAMKTVMNHLQFAHGVFAFSMRRGWVSINPVAMADRPPSPPPDPDVRFLDREELEALLRAAADDYLGALDRALWLTAAMTGLRQGELVALRWRDVDWSAGVIRVRRSFSRGQWTTPKSRRSIRAVPMADRVARELEWHFGRSAYTDDDDLVFSHPHTGTPYDASKSRVRFKDALRRAELREIRFHDLRHTYGTLMAAAGTPLRTLQGWMGHRDYKTTEIYADFAPDPSQGAVWAERAFGALDDADESHRGLESRP
jgi:integrase